MHYGYVGFWNPSTHIGKELNPIFTFNESYFLLDQNCFPFKCTLKLS